MWINCEESFIDFGQEVIDKEFKGIDTRNNNC